MPGAVVMCHHQDSAGAATTPLPLHTLEGATTARTYYSHISQSTVESKPGRLALQSLRYLIPLPSSLLNQEFKILIITLRSGD